MRILVAYFSASGITKEVAQKIASVASESLNLKGSNINSQASTSEGVNSSTNALNSAVELFEIAPKAPYSKADLDWTNEQSRTTLECKDKASRPELAKMPDISGFDAVFIGFPVWWYNAPHIVFSFLESADFSGKIIVPFCTSGGSGLEPAPRDMQKSAPNAIFKQGKRFDFGESRASVRKWIESLNLV